MTPAELARWAADYRRRLDHKIALDKIRTDSATWIANHRKAWADLRRKEEALSLQLLKTRVKWAYEDARVGRKPFPLALAQRWHMAHCDITGTAHPDDCALVPVWQRHADELIRTLKVDVTWVQTYSMNAYAFPKARAAECEPIISAYTYAKFLHEVAGHLGHTCTHHHVTTDAKLKEKVSVECEIFSWRAAIAVARPTWTRRMHDCLSQALPTYRQYGTPDEQREIDELASAIGFRHAQLAGYRRIN